MKVLTQVRRDFVIPTICCVSIVRFDYCVKCNSMALKVGKRLENLSEGFRLDG